MQKALPVRDAPPAMMPVSHRVGAAPFRPLAASPSGAVAWTVGVAYLRSLKSGTLMIIVATAFALVSAALSLTRDDPVEKRQDAVQALGLRGSLPPSAD